jgi:hypothetical protein
MPPVTIIAEDTTTVDGQIDGERVLVSPSSLTTALGWTLKPEGLCRDDVCVPVRDRDALRSGDLLDVAAVASALGRPSVVEPGTGLVAVALGGERRRDALQMLVAPDFELPDLDGTPHRLSQWRGKKRLLHAFSSW